MEMVFLNVQTTGLNESDQIIDIAVVNADSAVIFSSYCKPTVSIHTEAFDVHGFSKLRLKDVDKYEYAGTCCNTYGDKGHLFKPKQSS